MKIALAVIIATLTISPYALAQNEIPQQCLAGWTTTDTPSKRTELNSGAAFLDLRSKTILTRHGPAAYDSPPRDLSQYPISLPITVEQANSSAIAFSFVRRDNGIPIQGSMVKMPSGQWQITLVPQKEGWSAATGICSTG